MRIKRGRQLATSLPIQARTASRARYIAPSVSDPSSKPPITPISASPRFGADVVQLRLARKVMLRGLRGKLGGVAHLGDDRFVARRRWAQRDKDRLRFLSGFQFGVVGRCR